MFFFRTGYQFVVIICPGFIIFVNGRQIGIVEKVEQFVPATTGLERQPTVFQFPSAFVNVLVLPLAWIADSGLAFHIIKPHVFGALSVGPYIFARNTACVTAEAFIQI